MADRSPQGPAGPPPEQLVTFLSACGVRPAEQRLYVDAYNRTTADREAHRNGAAVPDLWFTGDSPADTGVDLITHTADGDTAVYQVKSYHQPRPGPPPRPWAPARPNRPPAPAGRAA
ncbi:hypothetical protein ACH4SK_42060 [Streptomyces inhibens]|uniref:hypothetical protein n=1 Tax=Streptomyces inhibens TaxID=2293571 RepID=UPI0037A509DB